MSQARRTPRHFVDTEPFDPNVTEVLTPEQERYYMATQWQLMWWKFRKHKIAVASTIVLIFMYLLALFAGFVSPYDPNEYNASYKYVPPMVFGFNDGVFMVRCHKEISPVVPCPLVCPFPLDRHPGICYQRL